MLAPPSWSDVMQMDEAKAAGVLELMLDRNEGLRKQVGPLLALTSLLK